MAVAVPRLMLVLDPDRLPAGLSWPDLADRAVAGGVDGVIVRGRGERLAALPEMAATLQERIGDRAVVLVNGDPETAIRLGLGIHLPEQGVSLSSLRERLGPDVLIGRSVHSPASAAASIGADYLLAGHVYSTNSHPGVGPIGLTRFTAIASATSIPVIAIGGINVSRIPEIMRTGASGIGIIDAIASAEDPEAAARELAFALAASLVARTSTAQE